MWLITTSSVCQACDSDVLYETSIKYKEFKYALFCEGYDEQTLMEMKLKYDGINVYPYHANRMQEELNIKAVPFMLVLNKVGQVIGAGVVNKYEHAIELMQPLIRSVQRGA